MTELDILNMMADIEARRASMRDTMRRLERCQTVLILLVAFLCGLMFLASLKTPSPASTGFIESSASEPAPTRE